MPVGRRLQNGNSRTRRRRLNGLEVRRDERRRARRAVRLFANFVVACVRETGSGTLSHLLSALGLDSAVAETIGNLAHEEIFWGGDCVYNALNWLMSLIMLDLCAVDDEYYSDSRGVVFISDSE